MGHSGLVDIGSACNLSPGVPSSQEHTQGTGVLWSLAGSDTDQSEGCTQSPQQLVHRHKGGSPGIAQNRSVLPNSGHNVVQSRLPYTGSAQSGDHRFLSRMGNSHTLQKVGAMVTALSFQT